MKKADVDSLTEGVDKHISYDEEDLDLDDIERQFVPDRDLIFRHIFFLPDGKRPELLF